MEHVGAPLANGVANGKPKPLCLDSIVKDSGLPLQQMEHVGAPLPNGVANGKPKPLCLDSSVKDSGLPLQQMEHFGAPLASSVASGKPKPLCLDSTFKDNGLPLQQMEQFGAPLVSSVANGKPKPLCLDSTVKDNGLPLQQMEQFRAPFASSVANGKLKTLYLDSMVKENTLQFHWGAHDENQIGSIPPQGNKFYLNRLQTMGHGSLDHHDVVSLPELLCPVESLSQIFIATFRSDILCVTIACHNREGCWSLSPDKRISVPFSDFPNLVVVYSPFPEVIAFGNDRKRSGIACHHPKLLALRREESIRVVITSANLVEKQVLSHYKWPEYLETDFVFGSSSIGSVAAQFLAAFSAASGKTSVQFSESEESDPDKTWQRLRNPEDASSLKKEASSFGWVYSRSHNFSAAAWGRPISNSLRTKAVGAVKTNSVLGSRLHVCNYELGIVFIIPPSDANGSPNHKSRSLDDVILPFVVPVPKYRPSDTLATKQAMREALAEWEREISLKAVVSGELMEVEEIPNEEEEVLEATDYLAKEREDEKAYADILWSQS
ncbi:unnamed protein product [Camellia sinensis]